MRRRMGDAVQYIEYCFPAFYGMVTAETPPEASRSHPGPEWRSKLLNDAERLVSILVMLQRWIVQRNLEPTCDD